MISKMALGLSPLKHSMQFNYDLKRINLIGTLVKHQAFKSQVKPKIK